MKVFIFFCYMAYVLTVVSAVMRRTSPMPRPNSITKQASKTAEIINFINSEYNNGGLNFIQSGRPPRTYQKKRHNQRKTPLKGIKDINVAVARALSMLQSQVDEDEAKYYQKIAQIPRYHVFTNPEVLEQYSKDLKRKQKKNNRRLSYKTSASSEYLERKFQKHSNRRYIEEFQLDDSVPDAASIEIKYDRDELLEKLVPYVINQQEATIQPSFPDNNDDQAFAKDTDSITTENEKNEQKEEKIFSSKTIIGKENEKISNIFKTVQKSWEKGQHKIKEETDQYKIKERDQHKINKEKAHTNDFKEKKKKKNDFEHFNSKEDEDTYSKKVGDRNDKRDDYKKHKPKSQTKGIPQLDEEEDKPTKKEYLAKYDDENKEIEPNKLDNKSPERINTENWKEDSVPLKDKENTKKDDLDIKNTQSEEEPLPKKHKNKKKQETYHSKDRNTSKNSAEKDSYKAKSDHSIEKTTEKKWDLSTKKRNRFHTNHREQGEEQNDELDSKKADWDKKHEHEDEAYDEMPTNEKNKQLDGKDDNAWDERDDRNQKQDDWNSNEDNGNKKDRDENYRDDNDNGNQKNDWDDSNNDKNNGKDDWNIKKDTWDGKENAWSDKGSITNKKNYMDQENDEYLFTNKDWNHQDLQNKKHDWDTKEKKSDEKYNKKKHKKHDKKSDADYKTTTMESNNDWTKADIDTTKKENIDNGTEKENKYNDYSNERSEVNTKKNDAWVNYVPKLSEYYKPKEIQGDNSYDKP